MDAFTFISLTKTTRNTEMTTDKHKGVDKVVSLERIVNWPFSFKLSLKIFVILFVLAHFIYIDSINNHISNHYKKKLFKITGYLRGSTLHMSSKYFSLLHSSLQDSWFWLHHSQGHQSHHPLSKSTVYQIGLLEKNSQTHWKACFESFEISL